ncbi:MAG: chorismate mutase [Candidatus Nanoarchaeia archaeon]|nr:chorismate mutase [Candidatus Nanoarchaeia archaeon]
MDLKKERLKIDRIDYKIIKLISERRRISQKIIKHKTKNGENKHNPKGKKKFLEQENAGV